MRIYPALSVLLLATALPACSGSGATDAYGNFEATEVTVSAQSAGRLIRFVVDEGDRLAAGRTVGLVDTLQLASQRDALLAQRQNLLAQQRSLRVQGSATAAQVTEAAAGAGALRARLATAEEELARTRRLFADQAATARELNEREGAVAELRDQLAQAEARVRSVQAQVAVPNSQADAVTSQVGQIDAQLRQIEDSLADASIVNPTAGTVLTVIAREGEIVQPGSPLYTIANLDPLRLRAYATGDQLPDLVIGMTVEVLVDDGDGEMRSIDGEVVTVSSNAEFTPTPIQTRDERADLVYAFEVRVPNRDGALKIGMPGEVRFRDAGTDTGD